MTTLKVARHTLQEDTSSIAYLRRREIRIRPCELLLKFTDGERGRYRIMED